MKLHHIRFLFTGRQCPIGFDLPYADELKDFDNCFRLNLRKHLTILTWWSLSNCIGGLMALFILKGSAYYFCMMSGAWGVINFAVAIAFFHHTIYKKSRKKSTFERLVVQSHVEAMLFLNIGIDAAFVFVGFWLREHSFICNLSYANLWLGFGWAIVTQGLFLIVQDVTFLRLHRRNSRKVQPFLETLLEGR